MNYENTLKYYKIYNISNYKIQYKNIKKHQLKGILSAI